MRVLASLAFLWSKKNRSLSDENQAKIKRLGLNKIWLKFGKGDENINVHVFKDGFGFDDRYAMKNGMVKYVAPQTTVTTIKIPNTKSILDKLDQSINEGADILCMIGDPFHRIELSNEDYIRLTNLTERAIIIVDVGEYGKWISGGIPMHHGIIPISLCNQNGKLSPTSNKLVYGVMALVPATTSVEATLTFAGMVALALSCSLGYRRKVKPIKATFYDTGKKHRVIHGDATKGDVVNTYMMDAYKAIGQLAMRKNYP